jgi:hypothetical protein
MTYTLTFIGVMISMFLVDICWAKYFIYVSEKKPFQSAVWGCLIMIFGAFTTINYVEDRSLLIAAIIGGFAGTYTAVYKEARKTEK